MFHTGNCEEEACKKAGARWYPHEWTSNVASSAATLNADNSGANADAGADADADANADVNADAGANDGADANADAGDGANAGADAGAGASSEGFLTGASDLLDEPFMAYNSGSSLVGADLTENFMSFNELN